MSETFKDAVTKAGSAQVEGVEHLDVTQQRAKEDKQRLDTLYGERMDALHFDEGKSRVELVPPEAIFAVGDILGGNTKYPDRNWERGMEWGKVYGSLQRHLNSWWAGEDIDPESGKPHIEHALANLSFLVTYARRDIGTDNRPHNNG